MDRFRFGDSFAISPHGLFIAIGFLIGRLAVRADRRPVGVLAEPAINGVVFWSLIGAIVGSRLFYVSRTAPSSTKSVQMLAIWQGGISLLGGSPVR